MEGVFGFFVSSVCGGILVDFLPEFPHEGLALGDFEDEGRLDMDHHRLNNFKVPVWEVNKLYFYNKS